MLNDILKAAVAQGASDIHLKAGAIPIIRKHGELLPIDSEASPITAEQVEQVALQVMNEEQKTIFSEKHQVDLSFGVSRLGRFRLNIFKQRGSMRIVIRTLPTEVPVLSSLHLPKVIKKLAMSERGLILVTGAAGSGKSTTLASMVNYINTHARRHILTIEDPIEFLIRDKKSLITQRELGSDTTSFHEALNASLRQDPNVILIGEMRNKETIETALLAAATGHLVLSTLHTLHASETVNRIIGSFPAEQQQQVRLQLASALRAVISQRLTQKPNEQGFAPAVEVLINTARVREMIEVPSKTSRLIQAIEEGHAAYGMQTFDQSLMGLVIDKVISYEEAMRHSTSPEDFSIKYSGVVSSSTSDNKKWEEKSEYKERIQDKWHNLTTIELENVEEHTITAVNSAVRIKGSRSPRKKRR